MIHIEQFLFCVNWWLAVRSQFFTKIELQFEQRNSIINITTEDHEFIVFNKIFLQLSDCAVPKIIKILYRVKTLFSDTYLLKPYLLGTL